MVVEAIADLEQKTGVSLQAIRKYVTMNFNLKKQQTASFNNLTLKAVNKAIALQLVEKTNGLSFKLSSSEKEKRRNNDGHSDDEVY
jgi:hypothetical protein